MHWHKLGLVYKTSGRCNWVMSNASIPIADHINGDIYRVYFTAVNTKLKSHILWFEFDISEPNKTLRVSEIPVLCHGGRGTFDADGVIGCQIVRSGQERRLYYVGCNRAVDIPYRYSIGLVVQNDPKGSFKRYIDGPILDRGPTDPYFVSGHEVVKEGATWHIWYLSGFKWLLSVPPTSFSRLHYAVSDNGIDWRRHGTVAMDFDIPQNTKYSRPTILNDGHSWHMWFCNCDSYGKYRIRYADSVDSIFWKIHNNHASITTSDTGWDSGMVFSPYVFDHKGERYMMYNGKGDNKNGIGLAILE